MDYCNLCLIHLILSESGLILQPLYSDARKPRIVWHADESLTKVVA